VGGNVFIGLNPVLSILPGFKGASAESSTVTYDLPNSGTHYFWDNLETSGQITAGSKITSGSTITATGQITGASFNATSDYRIKSNIHNLDDSTNIDKLKPVHYYNSQLKKEDIGFIAHELQEEFPFLVNGEKDGKEYQNINYNGIIGILVKEVQELKKQVKELQEKVHKLENP
jgi:hypothetical protein